MYGYNIQDPSEIGAVNGKYLQLLPDQEVTTSNTRSNFQHAHDFDFFVNVHFDF